MRLRAALVVLLLPAGALARDPGGLLAQQSAADTVAAPTPAALVEEADLLYDRFMPRDALDRLEAALERDSLHVEARWKAARAAVNVGMLAPEDRRKEWYLRAEEHARAALRDAGRRAGEAERADAEGADHPEIEARHWLSVALGRRALEEGIRTRVRLAGEVREHALAVLALDSLHPGAHHVLGQWHAEVRRLSGIERWVASKILGGDQMSQASWDEARAHLERAVELAPGTLIHRLELARVLLDLDENEAARRQLERVLELPAVEPTDPLHKQEAQELLREMG